MARWLVLVATLALFAASAVVSETQGKKNLISKLSILNSFGTSSLFSFIYLFPFYSPPSIVTLFCLNTNKGEEDEEKEIDFEGRGGIRNLCVRQLRTQKKRGFFSLSLSFLFQFPK